MSPDGDPLAPLGPYPERLVEALGPSRSVLEAASRTTLLAAGGIVVGLVLGWLAALIRARFSRAASSARADRPISDRSAGLMMALAIPGLAWLPLHRLAVDRDLIPGDASGPIDTNPENLSSYGLWAGLIGIALAPTVAAALTGGRSWSAEGAGGHVGLGNLAARPSSDQRWRVGLPTATLAATLLVAEVAASTGGLFDRFVAALNEGEPDQLLPLSVPLIVAAAIVVPLIDVGAAALHRLEKPRVPGSDRVRPGKGPAFTAITAVLVVGGAAMAGVLIGPDPDSVGPALAGPRADAWLGTDGAGRSVAERTAAALAATLAASTIPAVVATAVGTGLAFVRRTLRPRSQAGFDVLVDLASWPGVLVVPIAAWSAAGSPRSLLDPVVLQVTGLLLVPMATRLLVGPARGAIRLARLGAVACLVSMAALTIQLVAGFVVPTDDDGWVGLGQLAATGFEAFAESPWPLVVAAAAAAAAAAALAWSVGALNRVGRAGPRPLPQADADGGWSSEHPDRTLLAPVAAGDESSSARDQGGGPAPVSVTLETWPEVIELDRVEPEGEAGIEVDVEVGGDESDPGATTEGELVTLVDDTDANHRILGDGSTDLASPVNSDDGSEDIRDQVTVPVVVDQATPDEIRSLEEEASQTIELRPSDLRRAGVEPEPDS